MLASVLSSDNEYLCDELIKSAATFISLPPPQEEGRKRKTAIKLLREWILTISLDFSYPFLLDDAEWFSKHPGKWRMVFLFIEFGSRFPASLFVYLGSAYACVSEMQFFPLSLYNITYLAPNNWPFIDSYYVVQVYCAYNLAFMLCSSIYIGLLMHREHIIQFIIRFFNATLNHNVSFFPCMNRLYYSTMTLNEYNPINDQKGTSQVQKTDSLFVQNQTYTRQYTKNPSEEKVIP